MGGPVVETDPEEYQASCVEAQKLLNAAVDGAPTGLEYLYVDEGTAGDVAREVCDTWSRVLGVTVTPQIRDGGGAGDGAAYRRIRPGSYHVPAPGQ